MRAQCQNETEELCKQASSFLYLLLSLLRYHHRRCCSKPPRARSPSPASPRLSYTKTPRPVDSMRISSPRLKSSRTPPPQISTRSSSFSRYKTNFPPRWSSQSPQRTFPSSLLSFSRLDTTLSTRTFPRFSPSLSSRPPRTSSTPTLRLEIQTFPSLLNLQNFPALTSCAFRTRFLNPPRESRCRYR